MLHDSVLICTQANRILFKQTTGKERATNVHTDLGKLSMILEKTILGRHTQSKEEINGKFIQLRFLVLIVVKKTSTEVKRKSKFHINRSRSTDVNLVCSY